MHLKKPSWLFPSGYSRSQPTPTGVGEFFFRLAQLKIGYGWGGMAQIWNCADLISEFCFSDGIYFPCEFWYICLKCSQYFISVRMLEEKRNYWIKGYLRSDLQWTWAWAQRTWEESVVLDRVPAWLWGTWLVVGTSCNFSWSPHAPSSRTLLLGVHTPPPL